MLLTGPSALAQTRAWTITPSIGLRETYNDNVSLSSTSQSDWITQVSPGISITGRGRRLSASLNYTGDLISYARNRENDRLANTLSGFGTLQAVERLFFIDAQANVGQNYISPFAARPSDNTTITNNRVETRTWSLSPYVRSQLPGGYTYEVRNRNTWTRTDAAFLSKIDTRQWSGNLTSPISRFGWAIDASDVDIRYEDALASRPERKSRIGHARLIFQPDPSLRLSASAGKEENNFVLGEMQSYNTYGYGLLWRPGPRTTAQFDWERRYFGISPIASFEHRMRLSTFNVSYSKISSSYQQELFRLPPGDTSQMLDLIFRARIPDPAARQQAVEQFMRANGTPAFLANSLSFFTDQIFLQERLQGAFTVVGVRNSVSFTAFTGRSKNLTQAPPSLPADVFLVAGSQVNQHGFGTNASHRLTPFTSLSVNANRIYANAPDAGVNSVSNAASLNVSHTVSPKTTTFGGLTYTHFDRSDASSTEAKSAFVGLFHSF
jgi:uncharacterized protein (PEP-CTERM system associated)